jgi:hypothetical protein
VPTLHDLESIIALDPFDGIDLSYLFVKTTSGGALPTAPHHCNVIALMLIYHHQPPRINTPIL